MGKYIADFLARQCRLPRATNMPVNGKTLMRALTPLAVAPLLLGAVPSKVCDIHISLKNMRSQKGLVHLCLTANQSHFPDCDDDPKARRVTVAAKAGKALFASIPMGSYAVAIVHDENGNQKLDKFVGIPKEGIGFSRNPKFTFGPPKFNKAMFTTTEGDSFESISVKYYL